MFRNLGTSTKLFILCGTFIVAIAVAIYSLVVEKQIAIDFARKELVGLRYFESLRDVYAAILNEPLDRRRTNALASRSTEIARRGGKRELPARLQTATLEQSLEATLRKLSSTTRRAANRVALIVEALAKARDLASRVSDDSNLALDPDLDSYYLQDTVVRQIPRLAR